MDAGAIWRDVVTLKAADLLGIDRVGIGLMGLDGNTLSLSAPEGVATDWDAHRLLIPIR